jgi:hypothetical protein
MQGSSAVKLKAKNTFRLAVLFFYVITKGTISKIYFHPKLQRLAMRGASFVIRSQIRMAVMLVLLMILND